MTERLIDALHLESSLFIDTDGDQQLSEGERDNVVASTNEEAIPTPEAPEPEPETDTATSGLYQRARVGCQETQLSLLLLPLLFWRRRGLLQHLQTAIQLKQLKGMALGNPANGG